MKLISNLKSNRGIALILTVLLMTMILFLALYILNFSLTENRIAKSQTWGAKTYYLAEAGVQEMIWKLKYDATYKNDFETNPSWTASFTRQDPFGPGSGAYAATIVNSSKGRGEITASSSIAIGQDKFSQRLIKTKVYRLIGLSGMGTNAIINGGGTLNILNSDAMNVVGDVYSNSDVVMQGSFPEFNITGSLTTTASITEGNGTLSVSSTTQDNTAVPPPEPILLPGVDFNWLESQATIRLDNDAALDPVSSFNGIGWVNTSADIEHDMVINGLLVINGNLTITNSANITINHASGSPSGIIVNGNLLIERTPDYRGNIIISGLVYTTGSVTLNKLDNSHTFILNGGLTSGNGILIKNCSRPIQINFNNDILVDSLVPSANSPVMVIEHWEEEY